MTTHRARSSSLRGAASCRAPRRTALCSLIFLVVTSAAGVAQVPSPSPGQAQQLLQQNPQLGDVLRQRIQQSGLTPDQIRSRLRAAGYPDSLLNQYLNQALPGQEASVPGVLELAAIQALGLPPVTLPGQYLPVDTGMVSVAAQTLRAESLAAGNYVFGVDVFRRSKTQFLPLLAGPVPPDYRLGAGDQLVLILTGDVELAYTLAVTREGFILIPQVGQVFVNNLTLDQLRDVLYARLGRVYSGVRRGGNATTRFDVTVASVRANQVYVIGEVTQPGAYQISALGTVLTGLYAAGGVTPRANMRHVEVRRLGKPVATLDLYDYLLRGDSRSDIRLEAGDVVFVPVHSVRVQVTGAVTRPAIYDLRQEEKLLDLIGAAGGFQPNAALRRLAVYRILAPVDRSSATPARAVIDVALSPIPSSLPGRGEKGEGRSGDPKTDGVPNEPLPSPLSPGVGSVLIPPLQLQDGDSVVVDSLPSLSGEYNVAIAGMVRKPGQYPWHQGMTLRDLVLLARGPLVGADLREAEVARMPADRSRGQLAATFRAPLDSSYLYNRDSLGHYFGPPGLPFPGSGAPEVPLEPYDNALILKQPEFDFQRTVVLAGEVRFPGTYSLRSKADRLVDVLNRAGGLTAQAYPEGIHFVRTANNVGRINIDLKQAFADTTSRSNVILQPGDSIRIPEYQPSVKVTGEVNSPGSVLWQRGKDLNYYLRAAGWLTYRADGGKVSVRYANGEVRTKRHTLFFVGNPEPGPGSEVFVPVRDTTQKTNYVALFGAIAQILASTVAIIVVATR